MSSHSSQWKMGFYRAFTDASQDGPQTVGAMKASTHILRNITLGLIVCSSLLHAGKPDKTSALSADESLVQLAILLDTSNSMDGLIEQAKSQLWKIVNEFNDATQGDKKPVVQVALYEYGNSRLSVASHYIRQILPFTRDLDTVSEELFKLTTSGGEEYCGAVIREALNKLEWDPNGQTYKAIFIAGNEPFDQGPIDPNEASKAAIQRGIVVNTIFCGLRSEGEKTGWQTGAVLAEGRFLSIDQDRAVVHIEAPQDKEITQLSIKLNRTYVTYGREGSAGVAKQLAQDGNAEKYKEAGADVQRALTKSSSNYKNSNWDLVDANKKDGVKIESISETDLPKELRAMAPADRQSYIDKMADERSKLQAEINRLNEDRKKFLADKIKEQRAEDTLDDAISRVVREQASKKAIQFK
jgi:hypothetical protein